MIDSHSGKDWIETQVGQRVIVDAYILTRVEAECVGVNEAGIAIKQRVGSREHTQFLPWRSVASVATIVSTAATAATTAPSTATVAAV